MLLEREHEILVCLSSKKKKLMFVFFVYGLGFFLSIWLGFLFKNSLRVSVLCHNLVGFTALKFYYFVFVNIACNIANNIACNSPCDNLFTNQI